MESTAYVWKLVDFVPRAQYAEPAQMIGLRISAIASLVIALIGMALLRINRAMNAEDRAIVRLAQANAELESKVAERTRSLEDEVHVRRTAEQAARAGLDQYHSILDATSDGFWLVDERSTILDANAGYCESMGYRREEVVGHAVAEFELLQDATAIAATLARLERTSHINFESQHRAKDGTPRDLDISVSRVPGATTQVVFLRDIGARKRTEEKLKQMARIVEVADNGVMVTTPAGVITYVNAAFTAITGYTEAEAVGKTPAMLRSGRHHASFYADMWRQLQAHGHWQGYVWNRRTDGALFAEWLSVGDVRDKSGAVSHFVALFSDITRLIQSVENMEHLAHHDGLTGLPNRLLVSARLDHALERAARESKRVALMFIDLDHFKEVNDRAGHDAGDRLLQSVAARMLAVCRADDTLGRLGGDEFVVILEGVQDEADIERVGTELLAAFPMCVPTGDGSVEVTASIGLAYFPEDGHDAATLLKASDAAMYRAKQGGRNRMSRQDRCEPSERQP